MSGTAHAHPRVAGAEPGWWSWALFVLFLTALAWKLACLVRLVRSPLFGDLSSDSAAYWGWAQFLSRDSWLGHNAFFLGPLYPYLLALFHPTPSSSPTGPLLVQCVLGSATCVLLASAARRVCAWPYALSVGVLAAGNSMANLLDVSVLSESLLWFLGAVFMWLQFAVNPSARSRAHAVWSGLIIGMMTLARPSFGLLLIPVAIAAGAHGGVRAAVRSVLMSSCVVLACCLPVLARHAVLGYGLIPTTYSLGYNAYVGNGPGANGTYRSPTGDSILEPTSIAEMEGGTLGDGRDFIARTTGLKLSPAESSAWWLRATWSSAVASPGRVFGLWVRKAALSFNHVEASQIEDLGVHERILGPLGIPWVGTFGFVGMLGLVGLLLIVRRTEGHVLLAHMVGVWVSLVIFFVTDRYRHHLTLPLLVACGPAIEATVQGIRNARLEPQRLSRVLAPAAVAASIIWLPLASVGRERVEFLSRWTLAEARLRHGDRLAGESELRLALAPGALARLPLTRSSTAREAVANAMQELGCSYAQRGLFAESDRWLVRALEYTPAARTLQHDHAVMLALTGRGPEALCDMRRLGFDAGTLVDELNANARSAAERHELELSESVLRSSLAVDSTQELANVVLLRLLVAQGRIDEAHLLLERMRERGVRNEVVTRESAALGLGPLGPSTQLAGQALSSR
jgi:pentatricopeptide repeat protein